MKRGDELASVQRKSDFVVSAEQGLFLLVLSSDRDDGKDYRKHQTSRSDAQHTVKPGLLARGEVRADDTVNYLRRKSRCAHERERYDELPRELAEHQSREGEHQHDDESRRRYD